MNCQITKTIKQHLEYLGYSIEDRSEANDTTDLLLASHPLRSNLMLYVNNQEVIYIKAYFGDYALSRFTDILNDLNETNKTTVLTKWRIINDETEEEQLNLSCAASQIGYDKCNFSNFLDLFEAEIREHLSSFDAFTVKNNRILISQIIK